MNMSKENEMIQEQQKKTGAVRNGQSGLLKNGGILPDDGVYYKKTDDCLAFGVFSTEILPVNLKKSLRGQMLCQSKWIWI